MNISDGLDPYRDWSRCVWRNRVSAWRAQPTETLFHGAAAAALLLVLLWAGVSALESAADSLLGTLTRWPLTVAGGALALFVWRQWQRRRRLAHEQRCDWLASQPVLPAARRGSRIRCTLQEASMQVLACGLPLMIIGAEPPVLASVPALVTLAALLAGMLPERLPSLAEQRLGRRPQGSGRGSIAHWQRIELGAAVFGPALAPGTLALLLVPMGSPLFIAALALVIGLGASLMISAWNRSLSVIPLAGLWLAAQPLHPVTLLRASAKVPLAILLVSAVLLLCASQVLQLGPLGLALSSGFVALGLLQLLCAVVERKRPRRATMLFLFHCALLVLLAQSLPVLLLVAWPLQMLWLLGRLK